MVNRAFNGDARLERGRCPKLRFWLAVVHSV